MTKTPRQYDELFEDMMQYSAFDDAKDIKTKDDLQDFFREIDQDAKERGRKSPITKRLAKELVSAFIRLRRKRK